MTTRSAPACRAAIAASCAALPPPMTMTSQVSLRILSCAARASGRASDRLVDVVLQAVAADFVFAASISRSS
jgi:hypothetical protein